MHSTPPSQSGGMHFKIVEGYALLNPRKSYPPCALSNSPSNMIGFYSTFDYFLVKSELLIGELRNERSAIGVYQSDYRPWTNVCVKVCYRRS